MWKSQGNALTCADQKTGTITVHKLPMNHIILKNQLECQIRSIHFEKCNQMDTVIYTVYLSTFVINVRRLCSQYMIILVTSACIWLTVYTTNPPIDSKSSDSDECITLGMIHCVIAGMINLNTRL